jgi:hypothetical protein
MSPERLSVDRSSTVTELKLYLSNPNSNTSGAYARAAATLLLSRPAAAAYPTRSNLYDTLKSYVMSAIASGV